MSSKIQTNPELPIGVAVVGGGHWGPHLIRNFHEHQKSEVRWVVEPRDTRRKELRGRFPTANHSATLEPALEDPRVAAVVIATPTSTHFDLVKRCLEAGRHVLVEKPLTDASRSAAEVCRLAEEKRLTLMVGHVFLFNPAIRAAKDLIDAKELGTVYYASMVRTNLGPVRGDVNAAWDLASHDISIANFWFDSQPLSVSARGGSWLNTGVDDVSFATIQYPGDVLVHIHASWLHPRKARDLVVVGSEKMITVNDMDLSEPLRIYDKGVHAERPIADTFASFRATIREGSITIPSVALGEPLRSECDEFINRVLGAEGSLSDGRAGLSVVRALEALSLSAARRGAEVSLEEVD